MRRAGIIDLSVVLAAFTLTGAAPQPVAWEVLAPGLELGHFEASKASSVGDSRITVLRIDPAHWDLTVAAISSSGAEEGLTAKEWSRQHGLPAVINAGMFATDHRTHVGYMRAGAHVNNAGVNAYQSVAAFDPRDPSSPPFRILDLDEPGVKMAEILAGYASAVQNLRLVKRPGTNRWSRQERRWSEAALGEDQAGRILFIFCRSPYSMHDLNRELLAADLGLVAAQHLEGGPEAQLYLRVGDREVELVGSYETSFNENDDNAAAWPVPNVLGIRPRPR